MYDVAVQHNPQVKALLDKQQAAQRRQANGARTNRAATPGSVRAALQQAMAR
jgi:hypothetical protein